MSPAELSRYAGQMSLEGWGRVAQERLKSSRVLIAGAGGLAAAVAAYLLAAGVGAIRLVDDARVSLSDLNGQILFRERDLGKAKALVALQHLQEINSFVEVEGYAKNLSEHNLARLTADCDLLVDASHRCAAGFLLNQAAARLRAPLVHAWVWGWDGRLATFWPGQGPCLACVMPKGPSSLPPAVFGPLPGILGTLQAFEVLRILGGLGPALLGRLLVFKGAELQFTEKPVKANPQCAVCRTLGD